MFFFFAYIQKDIKYSVSKNNVVDHFVVVFFSVRFFIFFAEQKQSLKYKTKEFVILVR